MKTKSEFCPLGGNGRGAFEKVKVGKRIRDIFVVYDGWRIAYRHRQGGAVWVPLVEGVEVFDNADMTTVSIHFHGPAAEMFPRDDECRSYH